MDAPKLTPTQELLLDVLVARHRLGEHEWPFKRRHEKALRALGADLVSVRRGNVEGALLAGLAPAGVERFVDGSYTPTGFMRHADHIADELDTLGVEPTVGRIIRRTFGYASLAAGYEL